MALTATQDSSGVDIVYGIPRIQNETQLNESHRVCHKASFMASGLTVNWTTGKNTQSSVFLVLWLNCFVSFRSF